MITVRRRAGHYHELAIESDVVVNRGGSELGWRSVLPLLRPVVTQAARAPSTVPLGKYDQHFE